MSKAIQYLSYPPTTLGYLACEDATLDAVSSVICDGYVGCEGANITTTSAKITASGYRSLKDVDSVTSDAQDIDCIGDQACEVSDFITSTGNGYINCYGTRSCASSATSSHDIVSAVRPIRCYGSSMII